MWILPLLACASTAAPPPTVEPTERLWGEVVEGEGLYTVEPVSAGGKVQPAVLWVDGRIWIVSDAPDPTRYALVDRRVIFRGRTSPPSPHLAIFQPRHLEIEEMRLAPGETPNEADRLPAPPRARTTADLGSRAGLWVQAVGTLASVADGDAGAVGVLHMDEDVEITYLPGPASRWETLVDQTVTILAGVAGSALQGFHVCAGEAARCGMD